MSYIICSEANLKVTLKTDSKVDSPANNTRHSSDKIYNYDDSKIIINAANLDNNERLLVRNLLDTLQHYHTLTNSPNKINLRNNERYISKFKYEKPPIHDDRFEPVQIVRRDDDVYYGKKDNSDIYYSGRMNIDKRYLYGGKENYNVYYKGPGQKTESYDRSLNQQPINPRDNFNVNMPRTNPNVSFRPAVIDYNTFPHQNYDYRFSQESRAMLNPRRYLGSNSSYQHHHHHNSIQDSNFFNQRRYNFQQLDQKNNAQTLSKENEIIGLNKNPLRKGMSTEVYMKNYKSNLARSLVDYYYNFPQN